MFRNAKSFGCILALTAATLAHNVAAADAPNPAAVLTPLVNHDSFAAVYINMGAANVVELSGELLKVLPPGGDVAGPWMAGSALADGVVRQFQQAGGGGVYLVAGLPDVRQDGGPVAIVTAQAGRSIDQVEKLASDLLRQFNATDVVARRQGDVVIIGSKSNIERYSKLRAASRGDLLEPLAKLISERTLAAGVFCPGGDFRRVVREMWPELPGVLAPLKGELADRWIRVEIAANQPPDAQPRVALVTSDAAAAELFAKLWRGMPTATTQFGGDPAGIEMANSYAQLVVDSVPIRVNGNIVELAMPTDENQLKKLRTMLATATEESMETGRRAARMNQFRQLGIAFNNYYDVHKHLPPAALCDKDGKSLLSWRVAILPYLEQEELYKQFHLDEPWDSPHNRTLIEKMPAVYADPDPTSKRLKGLGQTTYQVVVGEQSAFHGCEGTSFSEMSDGTAHTVLLVEVNPSQAVEWTKPADWQVDLDHPRTGLERGDRTRIALGFADSHVQTIDIGQIDEQTLRAYMTSAGGEKVE